MRPATVDDIKTELQELSPKKVLELLLRLARFKKENKELLTWLLFESGDQAGFISGIKAEIDEQFEALVELGANDYRKKLRKMQRLISKPVKYMGSKTAAIELYLHFAEQLQRQSPTRFTENMVKKMQAQYAVKIKKLLPSIEDDLRHDYQRQLESLEKPEQLYKKSYK